MSLKGKSIGFGQDIFNEIARRKESYEERGKAYFCKKCGSQIQQTTAYISIHLAMFSGCAGGGEVEHERFPFCPKCEGKPEIVRGCRHV